MFYKSDIKKNSRDLEERKRQLLQISEEAKEICMDLYAERKSCVEDINRFRDYLHHINNLPDSVMKKIDYEFQKCEEFNYAVHIENDIDTSQKKNIGIAAGGMAMGGAIAVMGGDAAMAVATTFGTASTGVAISSLSGAAATNAALAWLGGGTLAAGGGGITVGSAFLALAGPIGWSVAGVAIVGGGIFAIKKNKMVLNYLKQYIKEADRDIALLSGKLTELMTLLSITREKENQFDFIDMVNSFPENYLLFDDSQKEKLLSKIIMMTEMTTLLNQRIF